jgi:hypothetical protein
MELEEEILSLTAIKLNLATDFSQRLLLRAKQRLNLYI